jgi:hypothetical protein
MKLHLLRLTMLVAPAAFSMGGSGNFKDVTDWKSVYKEEGFDKAPKCVVKVKNTIHVKGILDGKGCRYVWVGKNAKDCHAREEISENQPRMFEMGKGSTLKNMQIECMLEAIRMDDDATVQNVTVLDVEEDAISLSGKNNRVLNNKFYLASDKVIQGNQSTNALIQGNLFKHAARAFSGSGKTNGGADGVRFYNNRCINCELMIRAQSDHDVYAKGNLLDGGEALFETVEKAVIYNCGGNRAQGGADERAKDGTNNIRARTCP